MNSERNFQSIDQVAHELARADYIAERSLATVLYLAHRLQKPVFLEGEPGVGKTEVAVVMARLPQIEARLAGQVSRFMQRVRQGDFLKRPGVSETLDWAAALMAMGRSSLDEEVVRETIGCILKYQDDIRKLLDSHDMLRGFVEDPAPVSEPCRG